MRFPEKTVLASLTMFLVTAAAHGNHSTTYPQLTRLCVEKAKAGGTALSLGNAALAVNEMFSVTLECNLSFDSTRKPSTYLQVVLNREVSSGTQNFKVKEQVREAMIVEAMVKGKPEFVLAIGGLANSVVLRYILKLDSSGQPINLKDHFEGTVSPAELAAPGEDAGKYTSGIYISQTAVDAYRTCVMSKGQNLDECGDSRASKIKTTTVAMGARLLNSITMDLGWMATKLPTNTDLNRQAGRVDFQATLAELKKLVSEEYSPVESGAQLIKAAQTELSSAQD